MQTNSAIILECIHVSLCFIHYKEAHLCRYHLEIAVGVALRKHRKMNV